MKHEVREVLFVSADGSCEGVQVMAEPGSFPKLAVPSPSWPGELPGALSKVSCRVARDTDPGGDQGVIFLMPADSDPDTFTVKFVRMRNGSIAVPGGFPKFAVPSRKFWPGKLPEAGEVVRVRIQDDSKPEDPRGGVLFLVPATAEICEASAQAQPAPAPERLQGTLTLRNSSAAKSASVQTVSQPVICTTGHGRHTCAWYVRAVLSENGGHQAEVKRVASLSGGKQTWLVPDTNSIKPRFPRPVVEALVSLFSDIRLSKANRERLAAERLAALPPDGKVEPAADAQAADEIAGQPEPLSRCHAHAPQPQQAEEPATDLNLLGKQDLISHLTDPVDAAVIGIERWEHLVTAEKLGEETGVFNVLVDSQVVGLYDCHGKISRLSMPLTISGVKVSLSNGQSFCVFSHSLYVLNVNNSRRRCVFSDTGNADLVDRKVISWAEAETLVEGAVVGHEFRFQFLGKWLTTGRSWLPVKRPQGAAEWKAASIKALPSDFNWEAYLNALNGKLEGELIACDAQARAQHQASKEQRLTEHQQQVRAIIGKMWQGSEDVLRTDRIEETGTMIFHTQCHTGEVLHIVDNAQPGSIYVLERDDDARAIAAGSIPRSEARKRFFHIDHRDGWERALEKVVAKGIPAGLRAA